MELNINYSHLDQLIIKYGLEKNFILSEPDNLNSRLYSGIHEIIVGKRGFFTYQEKLVVLYIEDHSRHSTNELNSDPTLRKNYHLIKCPSVFELNRDKHCKLNVTNNYTGIFNLKGSDGYIKVPLIMCENCLCGLPSYKNTSKLSESEIYQMRSNYDLKAFLNNNDNML